MKDVLTPFHIRLRRGRLIFFSCSFLLVGFVGAISAAVPPPSSTDAVAQEATESPDFLKPEAVPPFPVARVILTLALLLGALYFVRPLLKKTKWGGSATNGTGLDIVGRVYLGPKAGLCLVQAEGRKFLVGVGADGVRLLAELGTAPVEPSPRA